MNALLLAFIGTGVIVAGYLLGRKIHNIWLFILSQIGAFVLGFVATLTASTVLDVGLHTAEKAGSLLAMIGIPAYIITIVLVKIFGQKKHDKGDSNNNTDVDSYQRKHSVLPKVIGSLLLVYTGLSLLTSISGIITEISQPEIAATAINMETNKLYTIVTSIVSILIAFWAIFIGIQLIRHKDTGRRHYNFYVFATFLMSAASVIYIVIIRNKMLVSESPAVADKIQELFIASVIYVSIIPIILLILAFLLNSKQVKAGLI